MEMQENYRTTNLEYKSASGTNGAEERQRIIRKIAKVRKSDTDLYN